MSYSGASLMSKLWVLPVLELRMTFALLVNNVDRLPWKLTVINPWAF